MMTKAYHAFQQKLIYFEDDIEFVDILRIAVTNNALTDPSSNKVLKYLNPLVHSHLSRRRNSDGSRRIIVNHLRQSVYGSYIKDVYEEVTEYLKTVLIKYFESDINNPRLIGSHSVNIDAKTLLALGNWEAVCQYVANSIFQALESERSTLSLLKKIKTKIGVDVDDSLIEDSVPYLQLRHFLVHADGTLPDDFISSHPSIPHTSNNVVKLDLPFIKIFKSKVIELIRAYDTKIVEQALLPSDYLAPQNY